MNARTAAAVGALDAVLGDDRDAFLLAREREHRSIIAARSTPR